MPHRTALNWKLRRIAAGFRQQDLAPLLGMSASRYSAIERGDLQPSEQDREYIERALPPFPEELLHRLQSRDSTVPVTFNAEREGRTVGGSGLS